MLYTVDDEEAKKRFWQKKNKIDILQLTICQTLHLKNWSLINHDKYHKLSNLRKLSNIITVVIAQNNDIILQQLRLNILKEELSETILLEDTRTQQNSEWNDWLSKTELLSKTILTEYEK